MTKIYHDSAKVCLARPEKDVSGLNDEICVNKQLCCVNSDSDFVGLTVWLPKFKYFNTFIPYTSQT